MEMFTGLRFALLVFVTASLYTPECHSARVPANSNWDFLLLAQFWPPTSCNIYYGKEWCHGIPSGVKGFIIHGLWPSGPGYNYPQYCDDSLAFDSNKIQSLSSSLDTQWPSLNSKGERTGMWSYEWEKHGTCGVNVPELKDEFNYFNTTLNLHKSFDLHGVLAKRGVTPSQHPYTPSDFYNAILAEFSAKPTIVCTWKDNKYYIDQIYLCYDKNFQPRDCLSTSWDETKESHFSKCPAASSREVIYLPLDATAPDTHLGR